MTRLVKVLVLLAAASTLTIACFRPAARRARKLARRSPPDVIPLLDTIRTS